MEHEGLINQIDRVSGPSKDGDEMSAASASRMTAVTTKTKRQDHYVYMCKIQNYNFLYECLILSFFLFLFVYNHMFD